MNRNLTFTILSTRAPLVEVDGGDGPYYMLPGGARVADAARTTAPLDLADAPVRTFRVEAPKSVRTAVIVTDSPFGAFAHVRRCVEPAQPKKWWRGLAANRWPRVRRVLKRRAPSMLAFWYLVTDNVQGCRWQDIGDSNTNQVLARGGDVVVVSFVNAEGSHE
jgi:hypothetical protein